MRGYCYVNVYETGQGRQAHSLKLEANPSTYLTVISGVHGSILCIKIEYEFEFIVQVNPNRKLWLPLLCSLINSLFLCLPDSSGVAVATTAMSTAATARLA